MELTLFDDDGKVISETKRIGNTVQVAKYSGYIPNSSYIAGKACHICEGFISMTDPYFICDRCRKKLKAFVEAEE